MAKIGKSLANLLRTTAVVSILGTPLFFTGCKKPDEPIINPPKDTTPPKITISSPLENKVYDSNTISYQWAIEEANFKSAWYSIDNEKTKMPIEKSGTKNLDLSNGSYTLTEYADDNSNNFSKKNVSFSVNKINPPKDTIPPKINISSPLENKVYDTDVIHFQGNITDENFSEASYSLNGEKVNIPQLWSEDKTLTNGNYRYIVKAKDTAGNSSADTTDFTVDKHSWKYFVNPFSQPDSITKPIIWNNFTTPSQRNAYLDDRLYNYDKTDTMTYIPGQFVCSGFASQWAINFNGYPELGYDLAKGLEHNGDQNIPSYFVVLTKPVASHSIDGVMIKDDVTDITNWRFIEPQNDSTYTSSKFNEMGVYTIVIYYTYVKENEVQGKFLSSIPMLEFVPDGNGGWVDSGYRNPGVKLKENRGK